MKKNVIWNAVGSTIAGFSSLFYMVILTRFLGLDDTGIFSFSYSLACLFFVVGCYSGRVYQVTDIKRQYTDVEYIIQKAITCTIMVLLSIIYCLMMGYDFYKIAIILFLCLSKALEAFGEVYMAVFQKNDHIYLSGMSLTIKSVMAILLFLLSILLFDNLLIACIAINVPWIIVLLFFDIPNARQYIDFKEGYKIENVFKLCKTGFYSFAILFMAVYLTNVSKYAMDGIVSESLQAIFGIIIMPATFINICSQYIIQPFINQLSDFYKYNRIKEFKILNIKLIIGCVIIGSIALLAAWLLGIPVLNFVYSVELNDYLYDLLLIIVGGTFYSIANVLNASMTITRNMRIQFIIYSIVSVFALLVSNHFIKIYSIAGGVYLYCGSMFLLMFLYFFAFYKELRHNKN